MRGHDSNIDPLANATVINVTDIWPPSIVLYFCGVLLDVDGCFEQHLEDGSQNVAQFVMPTDYMTTKPAK